MKKFHLQLLIAVLIVLAQPALAQTVKLAKIALGMSDNEVKTALSSTAPLYIDLASDYPDMYYLVAETEMESYAFTLIDGKVVGFSVVHILPPGQLPFLPSGQQPTVSILRDLITKQTWTPAEINKGDSLWFSDATGAPLSNPSQCRPESSKAWLPFGLVPSAKPGDTPAKSIEGLMKPLITSYPSKCGVSIHLNQQPGGDENSVVKSVRYQVLNIKAINDFHAKHSKHQVQ
ncbi:hypothetical protein P8935_02040 [Telmatobacter sp. DSM 110680]|uniref:Uncharacterized protein n=1 Tax=Telmatobacter sp. DSM 110680 TaxID=3036704 RepID=A0AAU7DLC0_9BACT